MRQSFQIEPLEFRVLLAADVSVLRIDCASSVNTTDSAGRIWSADKFSYSGWTDKTRFDVAGTSDDALYSSRRFGKFTYTIAIASAAYKVRLLMMDPSSTAVGQRKFDVFSEGELKLDDVDLFAAAGRSTAVVREFMTVVRDGRLNLNFTPVAGNATVSAIEVLKTVVAPTPIPALKWTTGPKAPLMRAEAMGSVIGTKVYVVGGFIANDLSTTTRVDVYDLATNKWSQAAPTPLPITHQSQVAVDNTIWAAGMFLRDGVTATPMVWRYDALTNQWSNGPSLPAQRSAGGMVLIGRKLYYVAGLDEKKICHNEMWALNLDDLAAGWKPLAGLPAPRNHFGYAVVDGKLYVIGGMADKNDFTGNLDTVFVYNPASNAWSIGPKLAGALGHLGPNTFAYNGKIYTFGGQANSTYGVQDINQFDPKTGVWTKIGNLPWRRFSEVAVAVNNRVFIATGNTPTPCDILWLGDWV